ncbi:MAG TPA: response regulator [Chloroflexota bacterium]|nr:response regulator [Chloroflexota bacterium]
MRSERDAAELLVEPDVLLREIHDALSHLHDLPLQRRHPLCGLLNYSPPITPARLRDLLIEGIEQLKPPLSVPPDSPRWRGYRDLTLRYLEGAGPGQVSAALGVGDRQSRRAHRLALRELAAILVDQARAIPSSDQPVQWPASAALVASAGPLDPGGVSPAGEAAAMGLETELARLEVDQVAQPIDARAAVEDAIRLAGPRAASRSVTIEYTSDTPSPMVVASRIVLRQIILSVLNYLLRLDAARRITISASEGAVGADICFHLSRLPGQNRSQFSPGAIGEASSPLAMANRLTEGQEGVLRVEESENGDVSAHLLLPTIHTTLVLVVDDNPDMVRLFSRFLRGAGFRLVQARNASAAFEMATSLRPDVIILDLLMPIQDGWDVFQLLRHDSVTAAIPIIACSIVPEVELAMSLGANGILTKPVTPEALRAALRPHQRGNFS